MAGLPDGSSTVVPRLDVAWGRRAVQGAPPPCQFGHSLTLAMGALWAFGGRTQRYVGGDTCSAHKRQREAVVNLSCGTAERLLSVTEPEPCKYELAVETRAACVAADGITGGT